MNMRLEVSDLMRKIGELTVVNEKLNEQLDLSRRETAKLALEINKAKSDTDEPPDG